MSQMLNGLSHSDTPDKLIFDKVDKVILQEWKHLSKMLLEKSENLNEEKNKPSPLSHNKHKKLL